MIGSGAAGLSAALAAAEEVRARASNCQVVLIERAQQGQHGGNTRWSPSYMRMAAPDRVATISPTVARVSVVVAARAASMTNFSHIT